MVPSTGGAVADLLAEWLMPETYSFTDLSAQTVADLGTTVDIIGVSFGPNRSAAETQAIQRLGGRVWSYDRAQHPPTVIEARVYRRASAGPSGILGARAELCGQRSYSIATSFVN